MNKAERIVGIAGFSESTELLEPSMKTASELLNIEDVEIFTILEALEDPEMMKMVSRASVLLPRSAGVLALSTELEPAAVGGFNIPYPVKKGELIMRATKKSANHARDLVDPRRRKAVMGILKGGGPGLVQRGNPKLLDEISSYSGATELGKFKQSHSDVDVRSIISLHDEIFPPSAKEVRLAKDSDVDVVYVAGGHDEQLVDPDFTKEALKDLRIN